MSSCLFFLQKQVHVQGGNAVTAGVFAQSLGGMRKCGRGVGKSFSINALQN